MIFVIPAVTLAARISPHFVEQVRNYFLCEERGFDVNNSGVCDQLRENFRDFSNPEFTALSIALLQLYPATLLTYAVDFTKVKKMWMKVRNKKK